MATGTKVLISASIWIYLPHHPLVFQERSTLKSIRDNLGKFIEVIDIRDKAVPILLCTHLHGIFSTQSTLYIMRRYKEDSHFKFEVVTSLPHVEISLPSRMLASLLKATDSSGLVDHSVIFLDFPVLKFFDSSL